MSILPTNNHQGSVSAMKSGSLTRAFRSCISGIVRAKDFYLAMREYLQFFSFLVILLVILLLAIYLRRIIIAVRGAQMDTLKLYEDIETIKVGMQAIAGKLGSAASAVTSSATKAASSTVGELSNLNPFK